MRVAEEPDLLLTIVLIVTRGFSIHGKRAFLRVADDIRERAERIIFHLIGNPITAHVFAPIIDASLSDRDLQALVAASVVCNQTKKFVAISIMLLASCLGHAPLLHRLVGPAGLPLALAKLLAGEGLSEGVRLAAIYCIEHVIEAAIEHGPPLAAWAKPIVKPLRAAYARESLKGAAAAAPPSSLSVGNALISLSTDPSLISAVASGMPDFVSSLRGGGSMARNAAMVISNVSPPRGAGGRAAGGRRARPRVPPL